MGRIIWSPDQRAALDALETGRSVFLTGGAGTGKSTLIGRFCDSRRVARLATTGAAAMLIGGQTVHSFFGLAPRLHKPGSIKSGQVEVRLKTLRRVAAFDGVLIDEVSMCRADQFQAIIEVMGLATRFRTGKRPFQLIAVGDFSQLSPVVTREERSALRSSYGDAVFAFEHPAWRNLEPHSLSVVHRQAGDQKFAAWLSGVRRGEVGDLEMINARVGPPARGAVHLVTTNAAARSVNDVSMNRLPGPDLLITGSAMGEFSEKNARVPLMIRLREGARVIICQNADDGSYVNGSAGVLVGLNRRDGKPSATVRLDGGGIVRVKEAVWENVRYEKGEDGEYEPVVRGSFRQLPLLPGWAITIHRSQGMSLASAHADLRGAFEPGQGYVALSRATTLAGLTLAAPITPGDLFQNPKVAAYHARIMPGAGEEMSDSPRP